MGLLQKISRDCKEAELTLKRCQEYDSIYNNSNNSSQTGSINTTRSNVHSFSPQFQRGTACHKFLWIRLALLHKQCLTKIVDHIVANADKFYAPHALLADPVDGPIFSSLLIGPATLEFTRAKHFDSIWLDPNADELIQRHKMRSSGTLSSSNLNTFFAQLPQSPVHINQLMSNIHLFIFKWLMIFLSLKIIIFSLKFYPQIKMFLKIRFFSLVKSRQCEIEDQK